jgi:hypothetical protein
MKADLTHLNITDICEQGFVAKMYSLLNNACQTALIRLYNVRLHISSDKTQGIQKW